MLFPASTQRALTNRSPPRAPHVPHPAAEMRLTPAKQLSGQEVAWKGT